MRNEERMIISVGAWGMNAEYVWIMIRWLDLYHMHRVIRVCRPEAKLRQSVGNTVETRSNVYVILCNKLCHPRSTNPPSSMWWKASWKPKWHNAVANLNCGDWCSNWLEAPPNWSNASIGIHKGAGSSSNLTLILLCLSTTPSTIPTIPACARICSMSKLTISLAGLDSIASATYT